MTTDSPKGPEREARPLMWAPAEPTDESARLAEALRFVGVVDPDDDCMSVFDTTGEGIKHWVPVEAIALRMLEHVGGVSSSEVEAPKPQPVQHEVRSHGFCGDRVHMKCVTCGEFRCEPQDQAEDWKDQHEADTLRPQVESPNHQANQHDEGRPADSGRLAPRPHPAYVENALAGALQDLYGFIPLSVRYEAAKAAREIVEQKLDLLPRPEDAAQAARSEATPEDLSLQSSGFKVGDEVRWCWHGDNADGTWFKARLTEEHPANYPKGWAGEITDCGTAYTAEHMGEVPLGFHVYMDVPSMTLVSEPSPSLRKEGEDSD